MMKFDEEIYDKIDAYIKGLMNEEEKLVFEEKMRSNPILQEEVALNKSLKSMIMDEESVFMDTKMFPEEDIAAIRSYRRSTMFKKSEKAVKESAESYFEKTYPKQKHNKKRLLYYASAVAAVLLIFVVMKFAGKQAPQELYTAYSNWQELPSLIEQGENDQLLAEGELLFKNRQYKEATVVFKQFIEQQQNKEGIQANPYVYSYLGISEMELGNYHKALDNFNQLEESGTIDYSRAYWYKALVYLKKSDVQKAKTELQVIIKNENHYNYQKAKELLEKLD